jgi:hypothetical protein
VSRAPQKAAATQPRILGHNVPDIDAAQRLTQQLADKQQAAQRRSSVTVDLVVGDNTVTHRLGTRPRGAHLTPTVADASFAWALKSRDERQAVITVVGVDQPGAELEFYA